MQKDAQFPASCFLFPSTHFLSIEATSLVSYIHPSNSPEIVSDYTF